MIAEVASPSYALVEPAADVWDAFVAAHPQGHLLQSAGWGALKSRFGWSTRRLALLGPSGLLAGAQVLFRRRFGLAAAYVPRGPLFAGDAALDSSLLRALDTLAIRERAVFLRYEPNLLEDATEADRLHSLLLQQDVRLAEPLQPHSSIHLDLTPSPERLLAAMSKGHRADIKRATRDGVTVFHGDTAADLDAFYAIMESTSARAGFGIHHRDYYAAFLALMGQRARLWLAVQDGIPQATAITALLGTTASYLYSGSTAEGLKSGAQHAIQWQAIQWARDGGATCYDFWGVPDAFGQASVAPEAERAALEEAAKADPLYGVFRFKKGFGGRVVRYLPAYDRVFQAPLYALWRRRAIG